MMMVDAHAHACGRLLTCDGVKTYLEQNGLDRMILCGGETGSGRNYSYPLVSDYAKEEKVAGFINGMIKRVIGKAGYADQFDQQNERVWEMAGQLRGVVYNAYWANPLEEDCLKKADIFYREKGFVMLKLHQCWTAFDMQSEMCMRLFCWAAMKKVPVFVHLSDRRQAIRFLTVVKRFPDTLFIVAHMLWAGMLVSGLESENVFFDLSSPQLYSAATLQRVLDCCGAEHLILGSDTPYGRNNIRPVMDRLDRLGLSAPQKAKICGTNIARLLFWEAERT